MRYQTQIWNKGEWVEAVHVMAKVLNECVTPEVSEKVEKLLNEEKDRWNVVLPPLSVIQEKARKLEANLGKSFEEIPPEDIISGVDISEILIVYEQIIGEPPVDYEKLNQITSLNKESLDIIAIKIAADLYQQSSTPRTY